jgi:hypothetical protein
MLTTGFGGPVLPRPRNLLNPVNPMPRQHRAPAEVFRDVLANGRVESPLSHQSLAQQILDCFVTCRTRRPLNESA